MQILKEKLRNEIIRKSEGRGEERQVGKRDSCERREKKVCGGRSGRNVTGEEGEK